MLKQPSPQRSTGGPREPSGPPLTFLIVDDQPAARRMIRQAIASTPAWQVAGEAESGAEALGKLDLHPDVVIMDVVMPGMNGLVVTRQIKSLTRDTLVILTTAYQNHEFRTRSLEAGADGFMLKDDLDVETLRRIVNRIQVSNQEEES